jgi:hypothetical protein
VCIHPLEGTVFFSAGIIYVHGDVPFHQPGHHISYQLVQVITRNSGEIINLRIETRYRALYLNICLQMTVGHPAAVATDRPSAVPERSQQEYRDYGICQKQRS